MHPSMLQFPNHLVWCCSFLFPPEMSGIFRGLFPTHQPSLGSFFFCSILASRPSAKGETTARQECTSFDLFPLAVYFPLPITMSHLMLIMMSYFAVERYTSVKWNERFEMGFLTWHSLEIWKTLFLILQKAAGMLWATTLASYHGIREVSHQKPILFVVLSFRTFRSDFAMLFLHHPQLSSSVHLGVSVKGSSSFQWKILTIPQL